VTELPKSDRESSQRLAVRTRPALPQRRTSKLCACRLVARKVASLSDESTNVAGYSPTRQSSSFNSRIAHQKEPVR
jgi:hypothetical protein